jgi:hypothetical protein
MAGDVVAMYDTDHCLEGANAWHDLYHKNKVASAYVVKLQGAARVGRWTLEEGCGLGSFVNCALQAWQVAALQVAYPAQDWSYYTQPNAAFYEEAYDDVEDGLDQRVVFVRAVTYIPQGSELLVKYGSAWWKHHGKDVKQAYVDAGLITGSK